MQILLKKAIKINDVETKKIDMDFDRVTGAQMLAAEDLVRSMGDQTPTIILSMKYHAALAAVMLGIKYDDIIAMNAHDFKALTMPVVSFLLN